MIAVAEVSSTFVLHQVGEGPCRGSRRGDSGGKGQPASNPYTDLETGLPGTLRGLPLPRYAGSPSPHASLRGTKISDLRLPTSDWTQSC
jgi:hypothetical protein